MVMYVLIIFASLLSTKHFPMSGRVEQVPHNETPTKKWSALFN